MSDTTLRFNKLHPEATLPSRGSKDACGLDIYSLEDVSVPVGKRVAVGTGLAVSLPSGFYGRVAPRSGLALKFGIDVLAGVIDADYRGEIRCILINFGEKDYRINRGDRIAQLIVEQVAILTPAWDEDLEITERNAGGFGSSGK